MPPTQAVATAALRSLFAGPSREEERAGLTTMLPDRGSIEDLLIDDHVATVRLSADVLEPLEPADRIAALGQITYTLTQFPTITGVVIWSGSQRLTSVSGSRIDFARPVTRADFEELTPPIFVESPVPGEEVSSPLLITGTANTFEATFVAEVRDGEGNKVGAMTVTATSGSGTRGTFSESIRFEAGTATGELVLYEISAEDGSFLHEVSIPLRFAD